MSSAGIDSDSVVNPTRSLKRTETTRISATEDAAELGGPPIAAAIGPPQAPQNFASALAGTVPHDGHGEGSGLPHSSQNRWPTGLSFSQWVQRGKRLSQLIGTRQSPKRRHGIREDPELRSGRERAHGKAE